MLESRGLKADVDFFLAFSPERVDPGNQKFNTRNIPKVVGGVGARRAPRRPRCSTASTVDTVVQVSSTRVAEMVKLLENTFRAVNIGMVNELALMCHKMDIDVWEVIDAAKTKPFGFMPFYPGPGARRPLHSDRSVLPLVEGAAERLRMPVHRARRQRQLGDARLRRRARGRGAQHGAQVDQRVARAPDRRGVQEATSTTCASRRRSTCSSCCPSAARRVSYSDPFVPELRHGGHTLIVGRSAGGAGGDARLRRDLHRSHRVRLRRAREERHAARRHAQRAQEPPVAADLPSLKNRLHSRHARVAARSARLS